VTNMVAVDEPLSRDDPDEHEEESMGGVQR
jgi:hypothetical protein